ncbi:MAG: hypothetical protein JWL98_88 [Xanthomonadaceae bacterium]|nr:hypothetical protein [Xanthomonadaceae bacterium]
MSDTFFHMSLPWWELAIRATIIYFLVMLLLRASGKRAVGQFTPFDMVLLILVGNAVQNGMNGGDNSLPGALLLCIVLIMLNYGVAFVSSRNRRVQQLVEGVPVLLARNGKVFEDVLKREHVSREDFDEALRQADGGEQDMICYALLETNGKISFVMNDGERSEFPERKPPVSART